MRRHLDRMVEVFGESQGCRMFRKIAPWYARRFGPAREFNRRVVLLATRAEFEEIVQAFLQWRLQFLNEDGQLKSSYAPAPLEASFMMENPAAATGRTTVPKGPVAMW